MQENKIPNTNSDDKYILESIIHADSDSMQKELECVEHRMAERKMIEYRNVQELERLRQKLECSLSMFQCFSYNPNPKLLATKSQLETEMLRLELKKGEEAVDAFRDVERLEQEKRKILGDLREDEAMNVFSGGIV